LRALIRVPSDECKGGHVLGWPSPTALAGLAQSVERQALNLVVVGSSPTAGEFCDTDRMVALLV
jgi:hypothetical protein